MEESVSDNSKIRLIELLYFTRVILRKLANFRVSAVS